MKWAIGQGGPAAGQTSGLGEARARRRAGVAAVVAIAAIGLSAVAGGSVVASATSAGPPGTRAALTEAIRSAKQKAALPGVIVGVWRHGKAPYVKTFGVRNKATGKPMALNLHMRIASVTKSFTVTAILQLVDRGKIGLDDPIARYISGVPHGQEITIRQLAGMRAGLYNYGAEIVPKAVAQHPHRQWTPRQLLAIGFRHPLLFTPGTDFDYSNTNTVLLGLVVEKVTGEPLRRYIDRQILRREHMRHTLLPRAAELPSPYAQGYTNWTPEGFSKDRILNATHWNPSWGWAAGGIISTLGDMRVWTRDLATGKLLRRATQRERLRFLPAPGEGKGAKYGLGIENNNGWIGHNGNQAGYMTFAFYLPSRRTTMVVMVNSNDHVLGVIDLVRDITRVISPDHVWPEPD
jgi:D-alanyl-D-alanine carboxypeptidase